MLYSIFLTGHLLIEELLLFLSLIEFFCLAIACGSVSRSSVHGASASCAEPLKEKKRSRRSDASTCKCHNIFLFFSYRVRVKSYGGTPCLFFFFLLSNLSTLLTHAGKENNNKKKVLNGSLVWAGHPTGCFRCSIVKHVGVFLWALCFPLTLSSNLLFSFLFSFFFFLNSLSHLYMHCV